MCHWSIWCENCVFTRRFWGFNQQEWAFEPVIYWFCHGGEEHQEWDLPGLVNIQKAIEHGPFLGNLTWIIYG
jgi:hypothetical protein